MSPIVEHLATEPVILKEEKNMLCKILPLEKVIMSCKVYSLDTFCVCFCSYLFCSYSPFCGESVLFLHGLVSAIV